MTLSTTQVTASYTGNSLTTTFAFPYKIRSKEQLAVYLVDSEGVSTLQTEGVDYTVDLEDVGAATGGSVEFLSAPATGLTVVIRRESSRRQETDLRNKGELRPETIEESLDFAHMLVQELEYAIGRCLNLPDALVGDSGDYDAESRRITNLADPVNDTDGVTLATLLSYLDSFTQQSGVTPGLINADGDGFTTRFSIASFGSNVAPHAAAWLVTLDGVMQEPGQHFSIDMDTKHVEFATAPPVGAKVVMRQFGYARGLLNPPEYSSAALPTPDAEWLGREIRVKDSGSAEKLMRCLRNSDGTYTWVTTAQAYY